MEIQIKPGNDILFRDIFLYGMDLPILPIITGYLRGKLRENPL